MSEYRPYLVRSYLSQRVDKDGVVTNVEIYRRTLESKWALKMIDSAGTPTVYAELFDTDDGAYAAFRRIIAADGTSQDGPAKT